VNSRLVNLWMTVLAPQQGIGVAVFLHFAILFLALCRVSWRQLCTTPRWHVFLGATVSLLVLWSIRTHLGHGTEFHLLGITAVTLVLGWPLTVVAASLAQLGLTLNAAASWNIFSLEVVINGVVPIVVTELIHRLARRKLPAHFFVYIFVGAFLGGALAMVMSRLSLAAYALASGGANGSAALSSLAYLPLMALPEALLNGMLVTLLVTYRPQWVSTFDDAGYLQGK
jgi:uncharacterized membrane protein